MFKVFHSTKKYSFTGRALEIKIFFRKVLEKSKQSKQSKFKASENFPRLPSFRFCLLSQIEY